MQVVWILILNYFHLSYLRLYCIYSYQLQDKVLLFWCMSCNFKCSVECSSIVYIRKKYVTLQRVYSRNRKNTSFCHGHHKQSVHIVGV